jgi:hypothetical protein
MQKRISKARLGNLILDFVARLGIYLGYQGAPRNPRPNNQAKKIHDNHHRERNNQPEDE